MGEVWLAQLDGPHGFGKWVAVKIMHPHLASDRRVVEMFLDEARIASRIQHTHVCTVLDFGEEQDTPFLVMEYLHGETLASVLHAAWHDDGAAGLPWWIAVRVAADAARGLHAAHELRDENGAPMGLVHRDVSPQNVFVQYEGSSKIVDFGVARATGRITTTKSGELKGKLAYMAPEQLRRGVVDRRVDIWAIGVVLWEAIAGRRLFTSDNEGETVLSILQEPIPKLTEVRKDCPTYLAALVATVLERPASKRPQTAAELADALDRCLYQLGEPVGHAQVGVWMEERFRQQRGARETMLRRATSQELSLPASRDSSPGSHSALRSRVLAPAPGAPPPAAGAPPPVPAPATSAGVTKAITPAARVVETAPSAGPPVRDTPTTATRATRAHSGAYDPAAATATVLDVIEAEPERITEPPAPPTVRAALPPRKTPVALLALAAAVVGLLVVAAVGIGIIVGRTTAEPVAATATPATAAPTLGSAVLGGTPSTIDSTTHPAVPATGPVSPTPPEPTSPLADPQVEPAEAGAAPTGPRRSSARNPTREPERTSAVRSSEPVRQALGQVNLLAIPAADVTWRGRAMGRTPLALRLPAGRQRLSLRAARGNASATITVDVRPGRTERRTVRLQ